MNPFASLWVLDPAVAYLNHGSFGACPTAVLEWQSALRLEMERSPVEFLARQLPRRLAEARLAVAAFVGADAPDLAFIPNATSGVSTVLRSLELAEGDELLTTDHGYGACRKALAFAAARSGARVVTASIPFPLRSAEEVVGPVLSAVTPRTRLALLDHVTSPTGLVFPVGRLVAALEGRDVPTLVDGAHALGMLELDLRALGASFYVANAHKWLCAPKGAAILYARRDRQPGLHPLTISHGYDPAHERGRFQEEFEWTGTCDPTPWLAIPECIRYLGSLQQGGWPQLMAANRGLALRARGVLCEALGVEVPAPEEMIGALASVPLPEAAPGSPVARLDQEALAAFFHARGIEAWFHPWACAGGKLVRVSAQIYNDEGQYRRLAAALVSALHGD